MSVRINLGKFLYKYRSFTPIPLIILVFFIFKPIDFNKFNIFLNLTGFLVSISGLLMRMIAVGFAFSGTSGRESFLKAEKINISGIYSVIRNPLYVGNFLIYNGLLITFSNFQALLFFDFFLVVQYFFIIIAEEDYLLKKFGKDYEIYQTEVSRILPVLKKYKKPTLRFNFKKVLFKENDSVFNMLAMFLIIIYYKEKVFKSTSKQLFIYIILISLLIISYIIIKIIKRKNSRLSS